MNAQSEAVDEVKLGEAPFDFDITFRAQYARVASVIARVVRDHGRAEELAVDVFLKFWHTPRAHNGKAGGWLYRAAVRKGLNELRRRTRQVRYERLLGFVRVRTPEEIFVATEEHEKVRLVLSAIGTRQAELLLLYSHGLTYEELASALDLNPASIGTLLNRARLIFRKEYIRRYGQE